MNGQGDILSGLIKAVSAGDVMLHFDSRNLVIKEELLNAICSNRLFTKEIVDNLIDEKLIIPVDKDREDMFHAVVRPTKAAVRTRNEAMSCYASKRRSGPPRRNLLFVIRRLLGQRD